MSPKQPSHKANTPTLLPTLRAQRAAVWVLDQQNQVSQVSCVAGWAAAGQQLISSWCQQLRSSLSSANPWLVYKSATDPLIP